jgi:hypothetical protein
MIIETIVSTLDEGGNPNFAPMGLTWGEEIVTVRPYRNTHTFQNMISSGYAVANITDDVLAFVQSCLFEEVLLNFPAKVVPGVVFQGACYWRELEIIDRGGSDDRAELKCRVLYKGRQKDFLGFCRAGNAVIEAAILATRLDFYDPQMLTERLNHYMSIIDKTGDINEQKAFRMVYDYIQKKGDR